MRRNLKKCNELTERESNTLTLYEPNYFFRRFSGHNLIKIGSFRLPTHRRDAHRIFF